MFTKIRKSGVMLVAAMLAMLAWSPRPALAQQEGTGIWVYNSDMSIALINLTNYPLTYERTASHPQYCGGGGDAASKLLKTDSDWQVEPYRTKIWNSSGGCFEGAVTLYTPGFPQCKPFDLVFIGQWACCTGWAGYGMWIGLSPSETFAGPDTSWKDWWAVNNWGYGRWATPFDDRTMHNVMTLIGSACMVALYSSDNKNLVVVVQQYYQEATSSTALWDDTWKYPSYVWDFVDNGGSSVPGQ